MDKQTSEQPSIFCIEKYCSILRQCAQSPAAILGQEGPEDFALQLVNNSKSADVLIKLPEMGSLKVTAAEQALPKRGDQEAVVDLGYPQLFFAHSLLLAKNSLFFQRMLSDESCFKEARDRLVEIQLPCTDQASFLAMLSLLYTKGKSQQYLNPITAVGVYANLEFLVVEKTIKVRILDYLSKHISDILDRCTSLEFPDHMISFIDFQMIADIIDWRLTDGVYYRSHRMIEIVQLLEGAATAGNWKIAELLGMFNEWASKEPACSALRGLPFCDLQSISKNIIYTRPFYGPCLYWFDGIASIENSRLVPTNLRVVCKALHLNLKSN